MARALLLHLAMTHSRLVTTLAVSTLLACTAESTTPTTDFRDIEPVCVEDADQAENEWTCDEPLTVECTEESVPEEIYVVLDDEDSPSCDEVQLATVEGPFEVGTHEVVVIDENDDEAICSTELRVVDEHPPIVTERPAEIWPPNHKMVDFAIESCFEDVDDCDPDWHARILWASSDEPVNDKGDGNTEPDIVITSDEVVQLRAERMGGGNGRVYTVGYEIEDHSGNVAEGECQVFVPHDQGEGSEEDDDGPWLVVER